MRNFKIDRKSIAVKLCIVMFFIVLLQSIIIIGTIISGGVLHELEHNALNFLYEKVANRKNYLQSEMNNRWKNINSFVSSVNGTYHNLTSQSGKLSPDQYVSFFENISPNLISMLRNTGTTGCFVILKNSTENGTYPSIYFKDYDPELNDDKNTDLFLLKGPSEISSSMQIPMDKTWNYNLSLDDNNRNFFEKTFSTANAINYSYSGYWGTPFRLTEQDEQIITYSVPLFDDNGESYGIIGVEISLEYFLKFLPSKELSPNNSLGYVVALKDTDTGEIKPIITKGAAQKILFKDIEAMPLIPRQDNLNSYYLYNYNDPNNKILAQLDQIKLYNNNTPFQNEQWFLIGLVYENYALGYVKIVINILILSFLFSLVVGVICVYFAGYNFTKPIINLAKKVKSNDSRNIISFDKTGFSEIDDLSKAIETLNQNVLDTTLKMSRIISMVNFPIGAYENKTNSDLVFVTDLIFEILDIEKPSEYTNFIDKKIFFDTLKEIMNFPEPEFANVYYMKQIPEKWVKIEFTSTDTETFGVVIDMTDNVLKSRSIMRERDNDALTQIYNRMGFNNSAQKIFKQGNLDIAALVMFDLDNLKYVNDTYGHDWGDLYIRTAANFLSALSEHNTVVARMAGDEFYVFFHNFNSKREIIDLINGFYAKLDNHQITLPDNNHIKVKISSGISWYREHSLDLEELIKYADFAMYEGKHTVKGELREFDKPRYDKEYFMLNEKEELTKILNNQLLEFVFQPIITAKTGAIYGYESLMRPQSKILSSPIKILKIASSQSKLWQIEKITFFKTLSTYSKMKDTFGNSKIFINSIPNQILKDAEYDEFENIYKCFLDNVFIEIAEDDHNYNEDNDKFVRIRSWGAKLVLDNFNLDRNDYKSIEYLKPAVIKVDKLMIAEIETNKTYQANMHRLLQYATSHDIMVLAQGIHSKSQMDLLISMKVDLLQGYYIGEPSYLSMATNPNLAEKKEEL